MPDGRDDTPAMDPEARASIETDILEMHRFFEDWFTGRCPDDDETFERGVARRLAPAFRIVMPGGTMLDRDGLLGALRAGHGVNGEFRIEIRDVAGRYLDTGHGLVLATYVEWQSDAVNSVPPDNGRMSSAVFERHAGAPNGFRWVHVHETWLPAATIAAEPFGFRA